MLAWQPGGPLDSAVHPRLAHEILRLVTAQRRTGLHAGAVVGRNGAWAFVGPRGAGKTTLLYALHRRGHPVLSDDVSVIDDGLLLAGPRCLDLRAPVAGSDPVRGDRHRVTLPAAVASTPLAGFVHLAWGDRLALAELAPSDRLAALADPERGDAVPSQAVELLDLVSRPAYRLSRPRAADVESVVDLVEGALSRGATDRHARHPAGARATSSAGRSA